MIWMNEKKVSKESQISCKTEMELCTGPQLQESFLIVIIHSLIHFQWYLLGLFISLTGSVLRWHFCHTWEPSSSGAATLLGLIDPGWQRGRALSLSFLVSCKRFQTVSSGALQATNLTMMLLNLMSDHECRFPLC